MKKSVLVLFSIALVTLGTSAIALSGIGSVAATATTNLSSGAKFLTAFAYVIGMAIVIAAIVKFKAHKDNPTQIPIGTPIALLFVGAALIFIPTVFKVAGGTMFGSSGVSPSIRGTASFGEKVVGSPDGGGSPSSP